MYYANNQWNLQACKTCHGADYKGGTAGVSCLTCHTATNGPENCITCHGNSDHINPPKALNGDTLETSPGVGTHMHHLFSPDFSAAVACSECHTTVNNFKDTSHFGAAPTGYAALNFGPLANTQTSGVTPNPQYDRSTNTCSNVYCHGSFKGGNQSFVPTWTNPESVSCGSCHGDAATHNPTPGAPNNIVSPHYAFFWDPNTNTYLCYQCHNSVINSNGEIVTPEKHINGVVNVYEGMRKHK